MENIKDLTFPKSRINRLQTLINRLKNEINLTDTEMENAYLTLDIISDYLNSSNDPINDQVFVHISYTGNTVDTFMHKI